MHVRTSSRLHVGEVEVFVVLETYGATTSRYCWHILRGDAAIARLSGEPWRSQS